MGRKLTRRERGAVNKQENRQRLQEVIAYDDPPPQAQAIPKLEPKNQRQKAAVSHLASGTTVVFLEGSAGTGKSMIAAHRAAVLLKSKKISKVWLVRPAVSVGKSIGLLPGEIKDKLTPYFRQTLAHLERFLGKGFLTYCLEKGTIEMMPVEYLRGMSFEDCMVIAEEVQNFDHSEMEMMLTRIGDNCQIAFTGDTKQNDLRQSSGLKTTTALISRMLQTHPEYLDHDDIDILDEAVGIVQFQPEDVVRSGLTRAFVKMYYHND